MSDWPVVALGDLVDVHDSRRIPLSKTARAERQGPYRYFGAQGVIDHVDDYIFDGEHILVAEDGENLRSRKQPIAALVSGQFWVNNHAHIISARVGRADNRFLLHALNTSSLDGRVTGAAQPKLTKASLEQLKVHCPSFPVQRRMAAVLATFDELIEINERRIALLEDLARSLYREWFIHFRFPGHEDAELVDSELGPVPEGWEVRRLDSMSRIAMGQSPRSEFCNEVGDGLPFHQGVADYGALLPVHRKFCVRESRTAEAMDVLCSVRAPVGRLNVADTRLVIGRGLAAVQRNDHLQALLLEQLRDGLGEEDSLGGGTIFKAIGKEQLGSLPMLEPAIRVAREFEGAVRAILEDRIHLTLQTRHIAATRDLLLPRLVTGRLDISDVDLGGLLPADAA